MMKTCSLAFLLFFTAQQAFSQTLTLNPPGPYIDACGYEQTATVTANPSGALSYDWYRDDCSNTWLAISGQTVDLSTGHWYCVATWQGGYTSTSANIGVRIPVAIWCDIVQCTSFPCASTGCTLEWSGPLCQNDWATYQWTLNHIPISGATNSSYNATASGAYHCIFGNTLCSVTSIDSAIIQFPCNPPTNRTTTSITSTHAKLNWLINDCATAYKVRYRPAGTTVWTNKNVNSNIGYKNISGLTPNTQYGWQVRSRCSSNPNVFSGWSATSYFNTPLRLGELGAEQATETVLNIYPNPAMDQLTVQVEGAIKINQFFIQNTMGQTVIESNFSDSGDLSEEIDVSHLTQGIYLITVVADNKKISKVFVKN